MMRIYKVISILLLSVVLTAGCRRADILEEGDAHLDVFLDIPQPVLTKADVGSVAAETESEYAIHSLQMWVFLSGPCGNYPAGYLVGYLKPSPLYFGAASDNSYSIPMDASIAKAHPNVDVFVIANAESAGYPSLDASTTRSQLESLLMEGNVFGIAGGTAVCNAVPDDGLPFTGVGKNLTMKGSYPVLKVDVVRLARAVSKLRFVFSQLSDEEGAMNQCVVTSVRINGESIGSGEYLFNDSAAPWKIVPNRYESSAMTFAIPAGFEPALNTNPEEYAYKGQTAQEYENLVAAGIDGGALSTPGCYYLREIDKKLSGTIYYTFNGWPGRSDFEMHDEGDFARNHYWIVYLYFVRDAIQFTVTWTPWDEGHDFVLTD